MIYLDHAATTPIAPEVLEAVTQAMTDFYGNPSSTHQLGKNAHYQLQRARQLIAKHLQVSPQEVYFTSGATESNNWAIIHQAQAARQLGLGDHIVSTAIEHPSVLEVLQYLETQGFKVTYLNPVDETYTAQAFIDATTSETTGWISMAVNNEVGSALPIKELGDVAPNYVAWYHVDAVQSLNFNYDEIAQAQWTSLSGSAHKFNGPNGVGFLVYRNPQLPLAPYLFGGGQESALRSGTENVAGVVGMAVALDVLRQHPDSFDFYETLNAKVLEELDKTGIDYEINGDTVFYNPQILNLWLKDLPSDRLLIELDLNGIQVSAGSACSAGTLQPSHVLQAYYPNEPKRWAESIRLSFGLQNTPEEVEQLVQVIQSFNERINSHGL